MRGDGLVIIIDSSGSMAEMGKIDVLKANFVALRRLCPKAEFFVWNNHIIPLTKAKELIPSGKTNIEELKEFITNKQAEHIFLISDGLWQRGDDKVISDVADDRMIGVRVGFDANISKIGKAINGSEKVWDIVDLVSLLHVLHEI